MACLFALRTLKDTSFQKHLYAIYYVLYIQKSNHFFGVLLFKIPYSALEISHFYLWGRQPPLSILKC